MINSVNGIIFLTNKKKDGFHPCGLNIGLE